MVAPPTTGTADAALTEVHLEEKNATGQESKSINRIFSSLGDSDIEVLARTSYRYLIASRGGKGSTEQRDKIAKTTIQKYLTVERKLNCSKSYSEWETAALEKLQKTIAYRIEKQVDEIRLCFDKENVDDSVGEEKKSEDADVYARIRDGLLKRYASKYSVVRGYTKDGRALFHNYPRTENSWEEEFYIKGNIYMMERALACTERNTDGRVDKVVVFYNYNGYSRENSPPPSLVKLLLSNLRDHWPERLQHVFIVDAPLVFRAFWMIIKHFVDPITKQLVQFISSEDTKKRVFSDIVSEDQAMAWMYEGGKVEGEADMNKFFFEIPFDCAYGEN